MNLITLPLKLDSMGCFSETMYILFYIVLGVHGEVRKLKKSRNIAKNHLRVKVIQGHRTWHQSNVRLPIVTSAVSRTVSELYTATYWSNDSPLGCIRLLMSHFNALASGDPLPICWRALHEFHNQKPESVGYLYTCQRKTSMTSVSCYFLYWWRQPVDDVVHPSCSRTSSLLSSSLCDFL